MNFLTEWFEDAKQVVLSPQEFFQGVDRVEGFGKTAKFALISLGIYGLLSGLVQAAIGSSLPQTIGTTGAGASPVVAVFGSLVGSIVGGFIGLFIFAGLIHLFVYLFGGRGYQKTFDALAYTTSVNALIGWIPVVNLLAGIYGIYVQARGIEEFHEISFGKALASVLLPAFILTALVILMAALLFAATLGAVA